MREQKFRHDFFNVGLGEIPSFQPTTTTTAAATTTTTTTTRAATTKKSETSKPCGESFF